jgi:hypothetical protein
MPRTAQFAFSDTSTFDQNIADFSAELAELDAAAGSVLQGALSTLANGEQDKGALLDALDAALTAPPASTATSGQAPASPSTAAAAPAAAPRAAIHWFLEGLEIEGFRGINNEGAPLALKFKPECVSSISAPNGVGKSSIYDALSFALRGKIEKLDRLLQAERGQDYYLNRFHAAGVGTVKLTLRPDNGGAAVTLSVLDHVREKLGQYHAVEKATTALATEWAVKGWSELEELEKLTIGEQEALLLARLKRSGEEGTITSAEVTALGTHLATIRTKAQAEIQRLADESAALSRTMPPSLVTVTRAIEAAQRLQKNWAALETAEKEATDLAERANRVARLKTFLDSASGMFAQADSGMAAARLARVEPLCQTLFNQIMFSPVTRVLRKHEGTEDLTIGLATFWTLRDVSAQALLSESYRNAFAVSVYLAAASLYGGAPRFIVLGDHGRCRPCCATPPRLPVR